MARINLRLWNSELLGYCKLASDPVFYPLFETAEWLDRFADVLRMEALETLQLNFYMREWAMAEWLSDDPRVDLHLHARRMEVFLKSNSPKWDDQAHFDEFVEMVGMKDCKVDLFSALNITPNYA